MFQLIKVTQVWYSIKEGKAHYVGTKQEAVRYMREILDVYQADIDFAFDLMESNNHNYVDFGVNRTPTFSDRRIIVNTKRIYPESPKAQAA